MKDGEDEDGKAKAPEETKDTPIEDKSDAEIIEKAAPDKQPQEKPDPNEKGPVKKGEANSIADQLAALAPIPDYKLAAPRKFSPVGGGHAKTTYLTILYGLIMPHMRIPPRVRGSGAIGRGAVVFYIDEMGNLTHQAVHQPSGAPDLDAAALAAVRRAAPFPRAAARPAALDDVQLRDEVILSSALDCRCHPDAHCARSGNPERIRDACRISDSRSRLRTGHADPLRFNTCVRSARSPKTSRP